MEKKTSNIIGQVGHSFDIILESMAGSTGYGWCLKSMPSGVELISTDEMPVKKGIAPVRQIFTFAALKPLKNGLIEFDLLCLYNLCLEPADHASFQIDVHDKDENDALKNEIGGHKFFKGSGVMVHQNANIPYGFPESDKTLLMYGFPPGSTDCPSFMHSDANCLVKYGTPFGLSADAAECGLKYGYPVHMMYGYPPISKYGYPIPTNYKYGFPLSNVAGDEFTVKEDAKNCVVKYGTPFGVAKNSEDCALKYGFPTPKKK